MAAPEAVVMPTNTSQASMPSSRDFGKMVALSFPRIGIMYTPHSAPRAFAADAIAWVIRSSVCGSTTIRTSSPGFTAIRFPRIYCALSMHSMILLSAILFSPSVSAGPAVPRGSEIRQRRIFFNWGRFLTSLPAFSIDSRFIHINNYAYISMTHDFDVISAGFP